MEATYQFDPIARFFPPLGGPRKVIRVFVTSRDNHRQRGLLNGVGYIDLGKIKGYTGVFPSFNTGDTDDLLDVLEQKLLEGSLRDTFVFKERAVSFNVTAWRE